MIRKIKYGKIAAVIFITVLIWVWADLAKTENFPIFGATISVAKSTSPNLWVSFEDDESSISIEKVVLKGSASKVDEAKRKLKEGLLVPEFFLYPDQEGMTTAGKYTLTVLDFLKKSDWIKQLGLTVESCKSSTLSVNVVGLVKRPLDVRCVDEDQNPIKGAVIEPAQVDMFVPEDWVGDAEVQLRHGEIEQARVAAIKKIPYIKLAAEIRKAATTVKITTPPEEDRLSGYTITATTLSIALSPTLQGKYNVEVTNLNEVLSPIAIRATPDAKRAYELQPIPTMTLYILDDDKKTTAEQRRKVVYNFPPEYVRKGEIMLNQQPVTARFKLTPLPSGQTPPSAEH